MNKFKIHICDYKKNMKKNWFVYVTRKNPNTDKREMKVFKLDVNRIHDKGERIRALNSAYSAIVYKIEKESWDPWGESKQDNKTLVQYLEQVYDTGHNVYKRMTLQSYKSIKKIFTTWLEKKHYNHLFPQNFTKVMANEYLDYIVTEKGYSGRTHNNHLNVLKKYFNAIIKSTKFSNPFIGISKLPQDIGKNFAFTHKEMSELKELIFAGNIGLYYFIGFMFLGLCRRTETTRIKIENIQLEKNTIVIHSEQSKTRRQYGKSISPAFKQLIIIMYLVII
jgi:integrase